MPNSIIFGGHFENMQLGHLDVISQLANIGFWIQHTKLPRIKVLNAFLHKIPMLVNFSEVFLTKTAITLLHCTIPQTVNASDVR